MSRQSTTDPRFSIFHNTLFHPRSSSPVDRLQKNNIVTKAEQPPIQQPQFAFRSQSQPKRSIFSVQRANTPMRFNPKQDENYRKNSRQKQHKIFADYTPNSNHSDKEGKISNGQKGSDKMHSQYRNEFQTGNMSPRRLMVEEFRVGEASTDRVPEPKSRPVELNRQFSSTGPVTTEIMTPQELSQYIMSVRRASRSNKPILALY